jgi:ABC-type lipoprotein release transport system permease subunit
MNNLFKMAIRDLGRNRRRSFFSSLALGIGLALLLLMAAVIEGEMRKSLETSIQLQSGHLQVRAQSYDENKTSLAWKDLLENPDQVAAQIASLPLVTVATPRLFANGIITTSDQTAGVRILGIDPASPAYDPFRAGMVTGEFITADDREGVLIAQSLADKLDLAAGDTFNLLVNTSSGEVDEQPFIIRGIYTTHTPGFDDITIFMPLAKAQAITRTDGYASTVFVMLQDPLQTAAVVAALQTSQYKAITWQEMNALIVQFEGMANAFIYVLYLIVMAITATVVVNTLIMTVFERTREIGILTAIGMRGWHIMVMFFAESALLAVGGIGIGFILGGVLVAYFNKFGVYIGNMGITGMLLGDRIYAILTLNDAVSLTILALVVTLLAALYPALLAARMEPVQALHGGK